jgi:hypothetical protein
MGDTGRRKPETRNQKKLQGTLLVSGFWFLVYIAAPIKITARPMLHRQRQGANDHSWSGALERHGHTPLFAVSSNLVRVTVITHGGDRATGEL